MPIVSAVFAFFLVVFVHELGHYWVGRLCGIGAKTFSIGLGPKIFSFLDKRNTEWQLCLLPIGGYVKFLEKADKNDNLYFLSGSDFKSANLKRRFLTVLAGPLANFLLSIIIFALISFHSGVISNDPILGDVAELPGNKDTLLAGDKILSINGQRINSYSEILSFAANLNQNDYVEFVIERSERKMLLNAPYIFQPIVQYVEMFSPASKAGLQVGDVFIMADNERVFAFEDIKRIILNSAGNEINLSVWRSGEILSTKIQPELRPTETSDGDIIEVMRIGVRGGSTISPMKITPSIREALSIGLNATFYIIKTSIVGLIRIIDSTISPRHLSGPVGVAKALSETAKEGLLPFFSLVGAISAGLGIVNLFPIPVLDGGHILFYLYEGIMKKPPSDNIMRYLMSFGVVFLVSVMIFATFNDILR